MIVHRRIAIFSVLGALLTNASAALAAEPVAPPSALESSRERMGGILAAISSGDIIGGHSALAGLFEGSGGSKPRGERVVLPARTQKSGPRIIKTAAGDGDEGWPPKNPITYPPRTPQRPIISDPPPPRQDPKPDPKPVPNPDPKPQPVRPDPKPPTRQPTKQPA